MICSDCREAGDLNWLIYSDTAPLQLTDLLIKGAVSRHTKCRGGTWCDCQHKLGKHLLSLSTA